MEERLIKEYVGKNSETIIDRKFNWVSAILGRAIGPVWFFYRKSYLIGFLFIIFSSIIGRIAVALNIEDATFFMFFLYGFVSNKLYLWDVKRKINKITLKNNTLSEEALIGYIHAAGKPSIAAAIIYVLIFTAFLFLLIVSIFLEGYVDANLI